jgi:fibronectin type 3 domain-containing protein
MIVPPEGCFTPGFLSCLLSGHEQSPECRADAVSPGPPSAPEGVTAALVTDSVVNELVPPAQRIFSVTWTPNPEADLVGYRIYSSTAAGGPYLLRGDVSLDDVSREVEEVFTERPFSYPPCNPVYYVVTAVDTVGNEGPFSDEAAVTRPCLDPPTDVEARGTALFVLVTWFHYSFSELTYNVYRSAQPTGPFVKVNPEPVTSGSYADDDVLLNTPYYYRVTAVDTFEHESEPSAVLSAAATGIPGRPAAPTGLTAVPGAGSVRLEWDDSTDPDLAGYNVYRATQAVGPFAPINGGLVTASDYLDDALPSTEFFYVVTVVDSRDIESDPSAVVSATPIGADVAPAAPTGLVGSPRVQSIQLAWDDNGEPDLAGYNVYRAVQASGPFNRRNGVLATVSEYLDAPASNEIPSFYRVTAVDTAGHESDPSAVVQAFACTPVSCAPASLRMARPGAGAASRGSFVFELTLFGQPSGAGSARLDRDGISGSGYLSEGTFELTVSSKAERLAGIWRSSSDWRLDPGAGTADATGVVLATFADPQQGVACLRFHDTFTAKTRGKTPRIAARGTFTLLGGTGAAARLLGQGHYALRLNADGSLTYEGVGRPSKHPPPSLPEECAVASSG